MNERWVLTAGSGLALALGLAIHLAGDGRWPECRCSRTPGCRAVLCRPCWWEASGFFPGRCGTSGSCGSISTYSWGWRSWVRLALGQWDEAATVAFLYGLSESLEAMSLERARRSIRALLDLAPPMAERINARWCG